MIIRGFPLSIMVSLLLFMTSASAQFGIRGGKGISDIAFVENGQTPYLGYEINSLEHRVPLITFQTGFFSRFIISNRFDFQPELIYAAQGLNYGAEYLYDDITCEINISYLQMPLLLKYKTSIRKKNRSGLIAGPYVSWKLKAVRITEINGKREKSAVPDVKAMDFGVTGGYVSDFKLRSGHVVTDLRCSYSLINMMKRVDGYIPDYYGPNREYVRNVNISLWNLFSNCSSQLVSCSYGKKE